MAFPTSNPINTWLDGHTLSTYRDQSQLEWPLSPSGSHVKPSDISDTGTIVMCKSLPGIAFVGPDQYTRMYRVKNQKHRPLLPRLSLHKGPSESSPIWAIYKAITLHEAWVEIPCRATGATSHGRVKVRRKQDGRRNKYVFSMRIRGREETFGWRRSKNEMIKDIGLSHNGYKLVRLTEGTHSSSSHSGPRTSDRMQVVALASRSHHLVPRCLALRYITSFGDEWELVSLVTVLGFWLWDRKHMMKG
ncbi:hypothetical protein EV127DRAFT_196262 [Xylaria flabelliformis]|nr:hypothetical protein EV127DRAFT_196262 [Xylaria flabelliformis]